MADSMKIGEVEVKEKEIGLEKLAKPELYTKPKTLTAQGLHTESRIDLYSLNYDSAPQSSVFIYPASYALSPFRIIELDESFSNIEKIISRIFKDASMEDLNAAFLRDIKPLIPFITHDYPLHKPRIIEHAFTQKALGYIILIISDLKV